ncbi:MAG: ABC transporter permease [Pseudomonadota bacterium]
MLEAFGLAFHLVVTLDPDLYEIIGLSLRVSLMALFLASAIGLPLGALVGFTRFPGRGLVIIVMNALMGMPPVVVGLLLYLMISRSGPFGGLALLYTPTAMILAQTLLILPIVAALTRQTIEDLHAEYDEQFRSLNVSRTHALTTLLTDARYSLMTVLLAGFGRAIAEVGAVIIVGGNINHFTRVMTTAIALETSKGDLALAVALGMVLLALALAINAVASGVRAIALRNAYV